MDYTCIEIFESDGIYDYFKLDPIIFTNNKNDVINDLEIFILQYPGNELSFSYGKILKIKDNNKIIHSGSTEGGSSGSPIISRDNNKYIIGLHYGGVEKKNKNYSYNLATIFDSILNDIYKSNEINCIYIIKDNDKEIQLLHDYNDDNFEYWSDEETKKLYLEAKEMNKKIFEEEIELYINEKKIKFNYKYKITDEKKEIKVKFKFKKKLNNMSYMFYNCSNLTNINLSSFDTKNITNMINMFSNC